MKEQIDILRVSLGPFAAFIMAIALLITGIHLVFAGVSKKLVKHIQRVRVSLSKIENSNSKEPPQLVK